MRLLRLLPIRVTAVAGPVVLAFFGGGYFDGPRLVALIATWAVVAYLAVAAPLPRPAGRPLLLALVALALFTAWVALSEGRAPLTAPARADLERDLLYLGALIVAATAWRARAAADAAEPLIALGILVVIGDGLIGRLLPTIFEQTHSAAASGRLEQPLTYWNATGALAAIGFVLCARIAGDRVRDPAMRALMAAVAAPLAMGVYLSFSRGALAALAGGMVVLVLLAPSWTQLRAVAICAEAGALACGAAALSGSVRGGGDSAGQGVLVLAALLAAMALAAGLTRWAAREERRGNIRSHEIALPRHAGVAAAVLVVGLIAGPVAAAGSSDGPRAEVAVGATNARFGSVGSNRYDYWKAALQIFGDHPLAGAGPGSFQVEWLERRKISERVRDAHSLEIETLAELGIVGFALLAFLAGAVVTAIRRVRREDAVLVAGPAAALTVWALHASLDWDWEMPGLTLVAVSLTGLLLARAGAPDDPA